MLHATQMATPANKEKPCFSAASDSYHSNNASALQQGLSFAGWEKHCFSSPHGLKAALPPCSPSESENSSSAFSTIGSSSSSSSFFNDTCSYGGIGELSPSSVGSTDVKSTMVSPIMVCLQEMHLAHAFTSTEKWEATATCTQRISNPVVSGVSDDGFLEFNFLKGKMIEKDVVKTSKNVKSTCRSSLHTHCDAGQGRSSQKTASNSRDDCATARLSAATAEVILSAPVIHDKTGQLDAHTKLKCGVQVKQAKGYKHKTEFANSHIQDDASPFKMEHASSHETEQASANMGDDKSQLIRKGGLLEQSTKPKRALSRASVRNRKRPNVIADSCLDVSVDTHEYLKCVLECGSSPFDTDIGIDIASLKHLPASMTPCKEISLSRALSLHQSPCRHGRPPLIPTPKLNNTPYSAKVLNLEMLQRRSLSSSCKVGDVSPAQFKQSRTSDVSDVSPCNMQDFRRIISIIHSNQDTSKFAKESYVSTARNSCSNDGIGNPSKLSSPFPSVDGKYVSKAPCLTSPLAEMKCNSTSASDSPVAFSFKARQDWRSRSVGRRASSKSTVRNLEAAFSGHGSVSLVKSSSLISEGADKLQNLKNMDMICVGSTESYPKEDPSLSSPDKPLSRTGQCNGDLLSRMPLKGNATPSSLGTNGITHTPKKRIKMPLSPISHKHGRSNFELLCKPLISVSRSIYQLPSPKDVLGIDNPCPLGRTSHRLSASALAAATSMLQASVQCIVRDGFPCYSMTVEGSEEVLIAKDCKAENDSRRLGPKWLYTFHLGKSAGRVAGWRRWIKKESKKASALVGVMKVSSRSHPDSFCTGSEGKHSIISEFVLYDGKAHAAAHSQSLRTSSMDVPPQRRSSVGSSTETTSSTAQASSEHVKLSSLSYFEMAEREGTIFPMIQGTSSVNSLQASTPQKVNGGHRSSCSVDSWSDSDFVDWESQVLEPSLLSHMELAAISISVPAKIYHNEVSVFHDVGSGGWGLKFLNSGIVSDISSRVLHTLSLNGEKTIKEVTSHIKCKNWAYAGMMCSSNSSSNIDFLHTITNSRGMENQRAGYLDMDVCAGALYEKRIVHHESQSPECLTLILPSGDHGLPGGEARGPSPLIERWQSGGSCECGGWDLGCGIEVLSTRRLKGHATSDTNTVSSLSHGQPISIFSQGNKQELMLKLSPVKQGLFQLSFQGKLSTLRAFATSVAILYSCQASVSSSLMSGREA